MRKVKRRQTEMNNIQGLRISMRPSRSMSYDVVAATLGPNWNVRGSSAFRLISPVRFVSKDMACARSSPLISHRNDWKRVLNGSSWL